MEIQDIEHINAAMETMRADLKALTEENAQLKLFLRTELPEMIQEETERKGSRERSNDMKAKHRPTMPAKLMNIRTYGTWAELRVGLNRSQLSRHDRFIAVN